jgi:cell division protein FtsB
VSRTTSARPGPRPVVAFFISLVCSTVLLSLLLVTDRRVLQLNRARAEVKALDGRILEARRENERLKTEVEAARRHDFPAEKAAREELNLIAPGDVVLLYPEGALTSPKPTPPPASPVQR